MPRKRCGILKAERYRGADTEPLTRKRKHESQPTLQSSVALTSESPGSSRQKRSRTQSAKPSATRKPSAAAQPAPPASVGSSSYWGCRSLVDRQAASAISKLLAAQRTHRGGVSIKALTLAAHVHAKKATFRVTCQTLKHLSVLRNVVQDLSLLEKFPRLSEELALVLCYELLCGEGLKPYGPAERAILSVATELKAAFSELNGALKVSDLENVVLLRRRAVRVHTLILGVTEAIQQLCSPTEAGFKRAFREVEQDPLLSDVLTLPPGTDLHDHPLVKSGGLVLQSKASCMPAHALHPQPGWFVLDACAAPGNKTAHLAALMRNQGRILALDRDPKRCKRLAATLARLGCSCATACCCDFLDLDPTGPEAALVDAILLDPSCSGSGTVHSRGDSMLCEHDRTGEKTEQEQKRLLALSNFQKTALRHAMHFPRLQRLVYSTCSVHVEENEEVVRAVLPQATQAGLHLIDPFPGWKDRGLNVVEGAEKLIRVDPVTQLTDGFFIAVFEKLKH